MKTHSKFFPHALSSEISKEFETRLKGDEWFKIVRRENSILWDSLIRVGGTLQNADWDFHNPMAEMFALNYDVFASKISYDKLKTLFKERLTEDPCFVEKVHHHLERDCDNFMEYVKEMEKFDFDSLDDGTLEVHYSAFVQHALKILTYIWMPLAPEEFLVQEITAEISKKIDPVNESGRLQAAIETLLTSPELTFIQQKENELKNVAKRVRENNLTLKDESVQDEIRRIHRTYAWILDTTLKFKYESIESVESQVEKLIGEDLSTETESVQSKKDELLTSLEASSRLVDYVRQASHLAHWRLLRTEQVIHGVYLMQNLFEVIKKRLGVEKIEDLFFWEISDALSGEDVNLDKEFLRRRKEGFGFLVTADTMYSVDGKEANRIKALIEKKNDDAVTTIKGNVAQRGFAKGVVKVARYVEEAKGLKEGEILVTSMTTPDYVPYMKIAAAIVTDEGGISCHAAIVSREMKKPCVIGTRIATQVLKDGDMVEVDADNGVVRIITKA